MPESEDPKEVSNNDLRNSQFGGGFINADTVNAQRIGGDVWNFFFGQQMAPVGNPARPENQRLLLAQVKHEVEARLDQSLYNTVLINLGKELQPQQVKRPWDAEIKIGLKPPEPLPENTSIVDVFDNVAGKLLILGAPGSGKTTTMLELAQALVARAEDDPSYPIPVLFNLSSWKGDRLSISQWLVAELKSKYGISEKLGKEWVEKHQLLLLLDGLDEMDLTHQKPRHQEINQLLESEYRPQYLVVCSRLAEYENYTTRLQLNGAICLQPLTNSQIAKYLTDINHGLFWQTISNDLNLLELVRTPLLLSVTILAYQEVSIQQWQQLICTEDRLQYLLDAYIRRMLTQQFDSKVYLKNKPPTSRQTQLWLVWLAKRLREESKTEFLLEKLQPTWLQTSFQMKIYIFGPRLLFTLVYLVFFKSIFSDTRGTLLLIFMLGFVTILGREIRKKNNSFIKLIYGINEEEITLVETLRWSGQKAKKKFIDCLIYVLCGGLSVRRIFSWFRRQPEEVLFGTLVWSWKKMLINFKSWLLFWLIFCIFWGLIFGLFLGFQVAIQLNPLGTGLLELIVGGIVGIIFGLIIGLIEGLIFGLIIGPIQGLILGLYWGLYSALFFGFSGPDLEIRKFPNQGIWQSAVNAVVVGVIFGLIFGLILGVNADLFNGLTAGVIAGITAGLRFGGTACIQHFTLRLILYCSGHIAWNYARFLDYCTERMLLQRVGGRYRFIHKLLQDHFAQMPLK